MKHGLSVTMLLVILFFLAQLIGLLITNFYLEKDLPYGIERPEINKEKPAQAVSIIFIIILISSLIVLFFARLNIILLWKIWFFIAVVFTLSIAFSTVLSQAISFIAALLLAFLKVVKRNIIVHNFTEIFIYGALAAVFVPVLNVAIVLALLLIISAYDIFAVLISKHMTNMAKFQIRLRLFAGLFIPYKKNVAILGGGDIGFPLLFAGVLLGDYGFKAIIVSIAATIALFFLLYKAQKKKFYPAMPFISIGCLVGYLVLKMLY